MPQPRTVRDLARTIKRHEAAVGKLAIQDVTKQHVIALKDTLLPPGREQEVDDAARTTG